MSDKTSICAATVQFTITVDVACNYDASWTVERVHRQLREETAAKIRNALAAKPHDVRLLNLCECVVRTTSNPMPQ